MKKKRTVTPEAFNSLLGWLDSDREVAGRKYEGIRTRLIRIFAHRGCGEAEELADETIDRVTIKVADLRATYSGNPALYFYAVAKNICKEYFREKPLPDVPRPAPDEDDAGEYDCLDECMEALQEEKRWLAIEYYQEERAAKINHRKELAKKLGIDLDLLRLRVHRIRAELLPCLVDCLKRRST